MTKHQLHLKIVRSFDTRLLVNLRPRRDGMKVWRECGGYMRGQLSTFLDFFDTFFVKEKSNREKVVLKSVKQLIILYGLLFTCPSIAQNIHLKAYRNSNLKQENRSGAPIVVGAAFNAGDLLRVLNDGRQTNGYYLAEIPATGVSGWVYRSLVQRIDQPLPAFVDGAIGTDIYIVDVGAGLGCIIRTPEGKFIIYDGGNSDYVNRFLNDLYPVTENKDGIIDLVIVSHTDSDHWRAIDEIAEDYQIKEALYTSYRPGGLISTIKKGIKALEDEAGIVITDLSDTTVEEASLHGQVIYEDGDFTLTLLSGFGEDNPAFKDDIGSNKSKLRNAASLVVKLDYADKSVLFTGDIKGLKDCDTNACDCEMNCISTEKYLLSLDSADKIVLDSDVFLPAHHGARNASCPDFIEAVDPQYVIFSAGNTHKHPHKLTATNLLNHGVPMSNIFRTDVGVTPEDTDDNDCNDEWVGSNRREKEKDVSFDDHIRIQITGGGQLNVGYLKGEG